MKLSFYTIDDLRLGQNPRGPGWRLSQFLDLRDALEHYRSLPDTTVKSLGVTNGEQVLELVRHLSVETDAISQADVLVLDFLDLPFWQKEEAVVPLARKAVSELDILYCLSGNRLVLPPAERTSVQWLRDKYLWPDVPDIPESAIRWFYVLGTGWLSPSELKRRYPDPEHTFQYPVVIKYKADGVSADGSFVPLELSHWEYRMLVHRTKERLNHKQNQRRKSS